MQFQNRRTVLWFLNAAVALAMSACDSDNGALRVRMADRQEPHVVSRFDLEGGLLKLEAADGVDRYVGALGEEAGIWGTTQGGLEAWAYPFKLLGGVTLDFSTDGGKHFRAADEMLQCQVAMPHAARMEYGDQAANMAMTLFVPRRLPGAALLLDINSASDLTAVMRFQVSLAPMLMAPGGQPRVTWDAPGHRLTACEPARKVELAIWSPAAVGHDSVDGREEIHLHIPAGSAKKGYVPILIAAGLPEGTAAEEVISAMRSNMANLFSEAISHYRHVLENAPAVASPDTVVNDALAWSVVSLDQLRVKNPFLGYGLVSGYSPSGAGTRPRYAWFFDEPTLTSWAYLRAGLPGHIKEAFEFLLRYQRADGKMVHEITQSLPYYPDYFEKYKYAYIHSSSGTYFLAACGNYYRQTGDIAFIRRHWPELRRMLDWCFTSVDPDDGLLRIGEKEWGSSESSFAVGKDTQMEGMWLCALRQMAYLAAAMNDTAVEERCAAAARRAGRSTEATFWDENEGAYVWGVDRAGRPLRSLVPHHSVSVWMESLRGDRVSRMLRRMARGDCRTDWGVRSLAASDTRYDAEGYQTGSVWPVWNAGLIIGDYRHGRTHDAFRNFMAMAQLRTLAALGPMPEVLSGQQCRLLHEAVPHQMFSETAVQNAFYEGLLGLDVDVPARTLRLSPCLPATWDKLSVENIPAGDARLDLRIKRFESTFEMVLDLRSPEVFTVELRPPLPAGCSVGGVLLDGTPAEYQTEVTDSSVIVKTAIAKCRGRHTLTIAFGGGLDFTVEDHPLQWGQGNRNLRLVDAAFRDNTWLLDVEGLPNTVYPVVFHTDRLPGTMVGARLLKAGENCVKVGLVNPPDAAAAFDGYVKWQARITWPPTHEF
jgi:glycogen debranching enzyme